MRLSKKLRQQVKKLSPGERVSLACEMFGCGIETDNYGQIVIYTSMKRASQTVDIIRHMTDKDFP